MDQSGGWPTPGPGGPGSEYGQILMTLGDMAVTPTHVLTPAGAHPISATTWIVQDNVQVTQNIPTWAIVLAVVFAVFCLLGLLFLLVKEDRVQGMVSVSVQGPGFFHATQLPVVSNLQVGAIHQQVNYVRSIAAARG
jgi:hypothetical protein